MTDTTISGLNSYLENQGFTPPSEEDQAIIDEAMPRAPIGDDVTYNPTSVMQDENAMGIIRRYMEDYHNQTSQTTDEEMLDNWMPIMRKWSAGQSMVTLNELMQLQKADAEKLAIAGQAYDVWDRFEGVFSEDYTWGDTFEGLGSYGRAVIWDPANLIGVGIGRAAGTLGSKAGALAMRKIAQEAADKYMQQTLRKSLTKETAERIIKEGPRGVVEKEFMGMVGQQASLEGRRAVQKQVATAAHSSALKKKVATEVAAATATDTLVALGVDAAYQQGMMLTGMQDEWSPFQSGLTMLGALGGGTLAAGLSLTNRSLAKHNQGIVDAYKGYNMETPTRKAGELLASNKKFISAVTNNIEKWTDKVKRGEDFVEGMEYLKINHKVDFTRNIILGNDEQGTEGLVHWMVKEGVVPSPRFAGDTEANFMISILRHLPAKERKAFEKAFDGAAELIAPEMKGKGAKKIGDWMSYQLSEAGATMQIWSQAKQVFKKYGMNPDHTVMRQMLEINAPVEQTLTKIGKKAEDLVPRPIQYYQNTLIQTIVAHAGTTGLNIHGTMSRMIPDTASDIVQGLLYTGWGARGLLRGEAKDMARGINMLRAAGRRPFNLLRPEAVADEMDDYMAIRPEVKEELLSYLAGSGIDARNMLKQFNMDELGWLGHNSAKGFNKYKEFWQKMYLVQAQDRFFKTQNFMYYLDKGIAKEFGMGYSDFMDHPRAQEWLQSPKYLAMEIKAVDDTMKSVFAKSFTSRDGIEKSLVHATATAIEQFRKVPIVGAALPFGQFFNNTFDMMSDYTSVKLFYRMGSHGLSKVSKGGVGRAATFEEYQEAAIRGAVGLTGALAYSMTIDEADYEKGLAWNEREMSDGTIKDHKYDFPYSSLKMLSRMFTHYRKEGKIPKELVAEAKANFGFESFFRGATTSVSEFGKMTSSFLSGDPEAFIGEFWNSMGNEIVSSWVSGYTRPLDPINELAGMAKDDGTFMMDRKTGWRLYNESFRYLDQILSFPGLTEGTPVDPREMGAIEKHTIAREDQIPEFGRFFSHRTIPSHSYTQRVMNSIGKPEWTANEYGPTREVSNRINQLAFKHLEPEMKRLWEGDNWKRMSTTARRKAIQSALRIAKEKAKFDLGAALNVEDQHSRAMLDIHNAARDSELIDRAMEEAGMDKDLSEYNAAQIRALLPIMERLDMEDRLAPYQ